jgi:nucleolar protein 56
MYSVILTELGISVLNEDKIDKAFPFSNPVKEYLAVKNKESKLNEIIDYLAKSQRGFSVSDESLLAILKKFSIDCHIMDSEELEKIQSTKPQIIVDSGFASNLQDTLGKLREFALGFSSSKVTEVSQSPDLHIIQAINSLDEIDKIANGLSSRLREWYGLHFPELDNMIDSINGYSQIVMAGKRESLSKQVFEEAGFPESKVEMLSLILAKSRGGDISDINLTIVQSIAKQILDFHELRKKLEEHVESEMHEIAPNVTAILGSAVGARILGRAGSLKKMASMPASTIQVLGAEKALFRALKTGSQPPKHGLLFQHAMVHAAPRWQRGKIARAVAAKAVIGARVDVYGEGLNQTLLDKLNIRVDEIGKKYENPTEKDLRPPQQFQHDDGNFGGKRKGGRRESSGGRRESSGGRRESSGGRRESSGGRRERSSYGGDRNERSGGRSERSSYGGDRNERSGGDRNERSGGDRNERSGGDRNERSGGRSERSSYGGDRNERSGGRSERSSYGGDRNERSGGDRNERSGGRSERSSYGGDRNERSSYGGDRNERSSYGERREGSDSKRKKFGRR